MSQKIKVSAPRETPHICYIDKKYKNVIAEMKKSMHLSLYAILTTCAEAPLDTTENIKAFKSKLKKEKGFKTIGEWATEILKVYEKDKSISITNLVQIMRHIEKIKK